MLVSIWIKCWRCPIIGLLDYLFARSDRRIMSSRSNLRLEFCFTHMGQHWFISLTCGSSLTRLAPVEAVLFDVDGTLCDSDPLHYYAFREMLLEVRFPIALIVIINPCGVWASDWKKIYRLAIIMESP